MINSFPISGYVTYALNESAIVTDGDSLSLADGATSPAYSYPAILATLPPISINVTPVVNLATDGKTAANMIADHSDIDAAFVTGKTNIFIPWTIGGSIFYGDTPNQAVDDSMSLCAVVKDVHPWKTAVPTMIPAYLTVNGQPQNQDNVNIINGLFQSANTILRASYKSNADLLIDFVDQGSPFILPDFNPESFALTGLYTLQGGLYEHCSDAGNTVLAQMVAAALRRMPTL